MRARFSHHTRFTPGPEGETERATVHLAGELNLESHRDAQAVLELCITTRPAHIAIDLTRLTLLDRTGVTVLKTAQHQANDAGVPLTLTGRPPLIVARLLNLTGTPRPPQGEARNRTDPAPGCSLEGTPGVASHRTAANRIAMVTLAGVTVLASLLTAFAQTPG
ncbi:STAS domain-containing protein [Streptomyces sp. NBC_00690]|uniref:STAS domain-containing protein n=1 Tax=Streptomyces sp. NBC_00690 TaxID=2975808 RepID=UPI002E2BDA5B|nr:STAS domain-containing protein [Streptomyces sp. NBC_00690]